MTPDEAIELLGAAKELYRPVLPNRVLKAIDLAIEALQQPTHCTASGYECDTPEITLTREQFDELMDRLNQPPKSNKGLEKLFDDDKLPPVNEATGHDTE